ncbi:MAG: agmatinase, partial [Bacteroidetes bacterium HGW-Bacteroidetes-22]
MTFDPNNIGIPNGNFFGLPYETNDADLILIPVPWDVTTSYRPGTANGPQAMLDASLQIDLFDFHAENAWENKISSLGEEESIVLLNEEFRPMAEDVIDHLSEGGTPDNPQIIQALSQINAASEKMNTYVYQTAMHWMEKGKIPAVVGGEHSVPLGLIQALTEKYPTMGILHIDAHADLRKAYEGFTYSHASIMYNALQLNEVSRVVQVGIRDVCQDEIDTVRAANGRIVLFNDYLLSDKKFMGQPWAD